MYKNPCKMGVKWYNLISIRYYISKDYITNAQMQGGKNESNSRRAIEAWILQKREWIVKEIGKGIRDIG